MMRRVLGTIAVVGLLVSSVNSAVWAKKCPTDDPKVKQAWAAAKQACPCDKDPDTGMAWKSHGKYVKCVKKALKAQVTEFGLPKKCKRVLKRCAAKSTCGKPPGFVACCRTNKKGKTKCSIKRAGKCKAPKKGKACESKFSSCCEACTSSGCASPSGAFTGGLEAAVF